MRRSSLRRAGKIERAAWVLGGGLLIFYGAARLVADIAQEQGLEDFRKGLEDVRALSTLIHAPDAAAIVAPSAEDLRGEIEPGEAPATDEAPGRAVQTFGATIEVEMPRLAPIERVLPARLPADTSKWSTARIASYLGVIGVSDSSTPEAILRIERIGLEVPVYEGTTEWNLNRGAARVAGTATIGAGNAAIAAHRDGYFRALGELQIGDRIHAQTLEKPLTFRVSEIRIVQPTDVHVLAPTDRPSLTLVTCYPFYFVGPAPQRYIVRATLEEPARLAATVITRASH